MALTPDERRDILAYLGDEAETGGLEFDSTAAAEFMLDHWDAITNPVLMQKKADRRELRQLRAEKPTLRDRLDVVNARIAELDAILNP